MPKGAKIFVWILILVVVALIIYIIVTAKKEKPIPTPSAPNASNPTISDNTDASNAGINTSNPPVKVETTQFNLNDNVYAGENTLNAYKSCSPSASNISFTFNNGDLIGTFLRREGNCIVVSGTTGYTYWLFGSHFVPTGSADYYIPFNANIYK